MKILVVGGGGREHSLAWKIAQSPLVDQVYCAPGNAGIAQVAECVPIPATDIAALVAFAKQTGIELTVVGPEAPLVAGIVDAFEAEGLRAFGVSRKAAELEGSKVFAKKLMHRHAVPTPTFRVFDEARAAHACVDSMPPPLVVKADGLAGGKGALVCHTTREAHVAVHTLMEDRAFGSAGDKVVIEECLSGEEVSILALTDGRTIIPMPPVQDHKRVGDGDRGPNTGGMGAYAPAPCVGPALAREIEEKILVRTIHAMNREKRPFSGVLYAGLMLTLGGPQVLEFNVRFGDPEAQPLLMLMKSDLVPVLLATLDRKLDDIALEWHDGAAVCVVLASEGYPGNYPKGRPISGLDAAARLPDVQVFHAGTALRQNQVVTDGGRVLGVTARGPDVGEAIRRAYEAVRLIHFDGMHYRRDIGAKAVPKK